MNPGGLYGSPDGLLFREPHMAQCNQCRAAIIWKRVTTAKRPDGYWEPRDPPEGTERHRCLDPKEAARRAAHNAEVVARMALPADFKPDPTLKPPWEE